MLGVGAAFGLTGDFCNAKRAPCSCVPLSNFRHAAEELLINFYRDKSKGGNSVQDFLDVRG